MLLLIRPLRLLVAVFLIASLSSVYAESPVAKRSTIQKTQAEVATKSPVAEEQKLVVYYFHGNARCFTCRKFETVTKDVVEKKFREDLKKGRLEYRVVNVEERDNGHFIKDYGLFSKSVVLSDTKDGMQTRWKNLDKIWEEIRDEDRYRRYIETEIQGYLTGI